MGRIRRKNRREKVRIQKTKGKKMRNRVIKWRRKNKDIGKKGVNRREQERGRGTQSGGTQ